MKKRIPLFIQASISTKTKTSSMLSKSKQLIPFNVSDQKTMKDVAPSRYDSVYIPHSRRIYSAFNLGIPFFAEYKGEHLRVMEL